MGIYFLESGAAQRASKVIYDRAGSGFATIQPGMIDWKTIFADADWFHWTGITPAVSQGAAEACREAILAAREMGVTVSCDLNYRAKLWKWGKPAGEVMSELVGLCDVALGNEEDAEKVFNIHAPKSDITAGKVEAEYLSFRLRNTGGAIPLAQDHLHYAARLALGQSQYLVGRLVAKRCSSLPHPLTISCPLSIVLAAATRSWVD